MEETRNPYLPARKREFLKVKKNRLMAKCKRETLSIPYFLGRGKRSSLQESLRNSPSFTPLNIKSPKDSPISKKHYCRTPKHTKDLIGTYHKTPVLTNSPPVSSDMSLWLLTLKPQFIADARITMTFSETLAEKQCKLKECHAMFLQGFEQLINDIKQHLPDKGQGLSNLFDFYKEILSMQEELTKSVNRSSYVNERVTASLEKQTQLLDQLQSLTAHPITLNYQ